MRKKKGKMKEESNITKKIIKTNNRRLYNEYMTSLGNDDGWHC